MGHPSDFTDPGRPVYPSNMPRWFVLLAGATLALGACSGKAEYRPPVDPMLPGDGYHSRVAPDCPPSVTVAQCTALDVRKARVSH